MRTIRIAVLVLVSMFAIPAAALADPPNTPQGPCANGNPTDLCGDDVNVVPATAEECPAGGIVVVVNDVRFPVCNGTNGSSGTDGQDGQSGDDGSDGSDGQDGTNGLNGKSGSNGADGANGQVVVPNECVSRRTISLKLPKRFRGGKTIRVQIAGEYKRLRINKRGRIHISLKGKSRGIYAVNVRKRGVRPLHLLYSTCGLNISGYNRPLR